jgi:hypothetical protein
MSMNYSSNVKFQDALGFYDTLYRFKAEVSEAGERANTSNILTVIAYFKKLKKLYKYVSAYILNNKGCDKKAEEIKSQLRDIIKPKIIKLDQQSQMKIVNELQRSQMKKDLNDLITKLEEHEEDLFYCIKVSQLELPMDTRNPHYSIREQDL